MNGGSHAARGLARGVAGFPFFRPWAADALALGLVVAAFSWICFRNIWQPGFYEDEAFLCVSPARFVWGNAVVNPFPHQQVTLFGRAFPLMMNTYTGPVKTYILAAAFSLFGVTVTTMRTTTGLIGLLGVVALYFLARQQFGRAAAAGSALLLATDLSYVLSVRSGWALSDFALLARVVAILLLLSWHRNRARLSLLFFGSLTLGLGLSHKVDFLGTAVAVAAAGALFYVRSRPRVAEAAAAAGGFLLGAWPVLLFNALSGWGTLHTGADMAHAAAPASPTLPFIEALWKEVLHRLSVLEYLLRGGIAEFFLGERVRTSFFGGSLVPITVLFLPILLSVVFLRRSLRSWRRPVGYFLTVFFVLFLAIAAVPMAVGPHHLLSLYPFPHLLLGVALAGLWHAGESPRRGLLWPMRLAAAGGFLLLLASNLVLAESFHERLAVRGGHWYWSESIYDLATALEKDYAGETAELLDWGFERPLVILGKDRFQLDPIFWRIQAEPREDWLRVLIRQPGRVFVRRAPQFAFDSRVHERFDAAWKREPDLTVDERKFFQRNGELSFSVLRFRLLARPE